MLRRALEIAAKEHQGQTDKNGDPYLLHPLRVMFSLSTEPERIGGLLHDVVEDTTITLEDLRKDGFSKTVLAALELVTKKTSEEDYQAFIDRALTNPLAARIKLADLIDNMNPERLQRLTPEKRDRLLMKYQPAAQRIRDYYQKMEEGDSLGNQEPYIHDLMRKALSVAVRAHEGQNRKGTDIPYIVHPVEVALILQQEGGTDEMAAAGLLHDVLEDGSLTRERIVKICGEKVAQLVVGASEELDNREDTPWEVRKQHTIHQLKHAGKEVQLISCADKLSNARSMVQDHRILGDRLWERFNRGFEKQKWYYTQLADSFNLIRDTECYQEFAELVKELFCCRETQRN